MILGDIWRYFKTRWHFFFSSDDGDYNKYVKQAKKPLCTFHFIENLIHWSEDFSNRIEKAKK